MRNIKGILRLKLEAKLSHRQIARSLNIGVGTVSVYGKCASALGLCWPLPTEMSDSDLEQLLFPSFGGVPEIIVPDQLRRAVSKPCRYEPTINASYQHMATHYLA